MPASGLMLLGFLPLIEIFNEAVVGMVALGLIFAALFSRTASARTHSWRCGGAVFGTVIHFALGYGGYLPEYQAPSLEMHLCLPMFSIDFLKTLPQSIQYLPIAIPFGILTIIGGINNTESARLAGDDYRTAGYSAHRGGDVSDFRVLRRCGANHALHRSSRL